MLKCDKVKDYLDGRAEVLDEVSDKILNRIKILKLQCENGSREIQLQLWARINELKLLLEKIESLHSSQESSVKSSTCCPANSLRGSKLVPSQKVKGMLTDGQGGYYPDDKKGVKK